jgi:hypothetical protein
MIDEVAYSRDGGPGKLLGIFQLIVDVGDFGSIEFGGVGM